MSRGSQGHTIGMRKVVFAGGTHCGKTTLVDYFANEGYNTVPESGIKVVNNLIEEMTWERYRAWRLDNQAAFFEKVTSAQIAIEGTIRAHTPFVFFDRGILDYIAMGEHIGAAIDEKALRHARSARYDVVFICEPLSSFDTRIDEGRMFGKGDSIRITELAQELYMAFGYTPVVLPDIPVIERIAIIKRTLAEFFPKEPLLPT